ncbi:hypothetical protein BV20DRAFT_961847 [Pilatotrama ljubarskyi]|nr:hypothetical protein BV20DRAFT_961847 [Pilatotrama ljubarskyi]
MSAALLRALARHTPTRAAQHPRIVAPMRSLMTIKDHKVRPPLPSHARPRQSKQYSAHATARGQGRNGQVKSDDDSGLELRLAMPKSLGGKGDGQNPEQLFAMGLACFLSALQMVAGQTGKTDMARNAVVHTQVHLGQPDGMEGFGFQVDIQVEGVDDVDLIQAGHKVRRLLSRSTRSFSARCAGAFRRADSTNRRAHTAVL